MQCDTEALIGAAAKRERTSLEGPNPFRPPHRAEIAPARIAPSPRAYPTKALSRTGSISQLIRGNCASSSVRAFFARSHRTGETIFSRAPIGQRDPSVSSVAQGNELRHRLLLAGQFRLAAVDNGHRLKSVPASVP